MPHPDQKFIDALVQNNAIVLEELYQKYADKIKWMVLQNGGTVSDAADLFQEALVALYDKAKTGNFVLTCPMDAFLYLVCRNKWLNILSKRRSRRVTILDESVSNIGEDCIMLMDELALQQERKQLFLEKLGELGESCRQLLRLSWSGKPMADVAKMLHVTYGYARKRKSECMAKLVTLVQQSSRFNPLKQ